ncbi:hypothetical protein [Cohnella fermenti]|uniref:Uncharacterized protein n=1 Tax=Cohnella fermenti TaxID=2565925 RepID=A0A4S4BWL2_9BACL|nr:hypothetical protein [Cohnella fermenti]THF79548.1 hypothetical protein E6C55_12275 [Cohnella fermenti]
MRNFAVAAGGLASLGCLLLCGLLLLWNPYSDASPGSGTIAVVTFMLILPACLGLIGAILQSPVLLVVVFVWSLPVGGYLAIAAIPGLFNLFAAVLLLYLLSAVLLRRNP